MDFYSTTLALLCGLCAALVYLQHSTRDANSASSAREATARQFQRRFLIVYALAVGADWLQGPGLYAWYKYEKQLPEELVAMMYATGFAAGAVSATVVGFLMDVVGPEGGCALYSCFLSMSCHYMESEAVSKLLLGRVCGGFATTLLFSAFESWMVTKYHGLELDDSALPLETILSNMTLVNSTVAIVMGIVSDELVRTTGLRNQPFRAAAWCSVAASLAIVPLWHRYRITKPPNDCESASVFLPKTIGNGSWRAVIGKHTLALGLAVCCFEGAMYLFVYFWTAALASLRQQADAAGELPLGLIFASFMCSMMIGSMVTSGRRANAPRQSAARDLVFAMLVACGSLSSAVLVGSERMLFCVFCVLEASIGAYFPAMGYLKGDIIDDKDRNVVYSMLRLPLNTLVLVAHCYNTEGDGHRHKVFLTLAGMLLGASVAVKRGLASC